MGGKRCTIQKDEYRADIMINNEVTLRAEATVGFRVLCTSLPLDNNFDVEIGNRLARANRELHALETC